MKRVTSACLLIALIFASFLVINVYETKDNIRVKNLGKTDHSFQFYITNTNKSASSELTFFKQLANKEHISIFRTNTQGKKANIVVKSVVFNKSSFPFKQFNLKQSNLFKHSQNTYASFKTTSGDQVGSIPVFWKQNKVLLQTMDHYYRQGDKSINGTYTVSSTKQFNKKVIVNQLSRFFSVSPKNLLTSKYNSVTGFINIYLMLFALIIVMSFLVLAIVIVYAPLAQVKEIGIKKLNGISNSLIFWDFIKTNTYLIVITSFIIDFGVYFYFNYRPVGFMLILVLFQLAVLALFLALNSFAYLIIKRVTISKMLKNFLNFKLGNVLCLIMKAFMTLLVTGLIILLSDNIQALIKQNQLNNNWQKYGNVLTLNQFRESNQESQDYLLGGHKTADKIFSLFTRLEKSTKAMYINGEVINPIKNLITQKGYSSVYTSKQTFQVMTVNENYLKYTHNKKLILARNKNNVRQFLVPSSYKKQSKKIKYLCQNLIFNDLTTKEQKNIKITDIPVQINYYNASKLSVFTYNSDNENNFTKAIFQVFNDSNATFYEKTLLSDNGVGNPIKIKNTASNRKKIKAISNLESFVTMEPQFVTDNSLLADNASTDQESITSLMEVAVAVFFLSLISSVFLLACIIRSRANELAVDRLLGVKLIDRYRTEITILIGLYIIQLIAITVFGHSMLVIPFVLLLIAIDATLSAVFILIREKQNLASALKGEQS